MPSHSEKDTSSIPEDVLATPAPDLARRPTPGRVRSLSGAAWTALVVGVVALIFILVFVLQNNVSAQFTFLAWTFSMPLGVAALFAAIGGALITAGVGTIRMIVLGRSVRRLRQDATRS
jgi:uncharacterized integral membrane protein